MTPFQISTQALHWVWDEYVHGSLKTYTRSVRGKGSRRRVESSNALPRNWQEFLRNDENKSELFCFLSQQIAKLKTDTERQIIAIYHKDVLCTQPRDTTGLTPCTEEEADTRIFLHVSDAAKHGYRKVMIGTVDSELLVLAIAAIQQLSIDELWVGFASGKSFRYVYQLMRWHVLSVQRSVWLCPSYTHLADVAQYHPLLPAEKGLCGTCGRHSTTFSLLFLSINSQLC